MMMTGASLTRRTCSATSLCLLQSPRASRHSPTRPLQHPFCLCAGPARRSSRVSLPSWQQARTLPHHHHCCRNLCGKWQLYAPSLPVATLTTNNLIIAICVIIKLLWIMKHQTVIDVVIHSIMIKILIASAYISQPVFIFVAF